MKQKTEEEESLLHDKLPQVKYGVVLKKIWKEALMVFFVFFVTLSLFPGVSLLATPSLGPNFTPWFAITMVVSLQFH